MQRSLFGNGVLCLVNFQRDCIKKLVSCFFFQQTSSDFCTLQQNSTAVKVYYQTHSLTPKNVLFGFLFNCFLLQMLLLLKVSMQSQKSLYRWRMYQDYWVEMFNYLAIQNLLPRTIHYSWLFGLKSHLQIPFTGI